MGGRSPTHLSTWTARCLPAPEMRGQFRGGEESGVTVADGCGLDLGKLRWVTASPANPHKLAPQVC